jgi:hypothetical protein
MFFDTIYVGLSFLFICVNLEFGSANFRDYKHKSCEYPQIYFAAYLCFVRKEQLLANNSSMAGGPRSFDHSPSYTLSHPSLSGRQHMGQAKGRRRCPFPVRQAWPQLRAKPAIPRGFDHRFSIGDVYLTDLPTCADAGHLSNWAS